MPDELLPEELLLDELLPEELLPEELLPDELLPEELFPEEPFPDELLPEELLPEELSSVELLSAGLLSSGEVLGEEGEGTASFFVEVLLSSFFCSEALALSCLVADSLPGFFFWLESLPFSGSEGLVDTIPVVSVLSVACLLLEEQPVSKEIEQVIAMVQLNTFFSSILSRSFPNYECGALRFANTIKNASAIVKQS